MRPICVDANMVIRLVVDVADAHIAPLWMAWDDEGRRMVAPTLLFPEVTNALHQYARQGVLVAAEAALALETALRLPVVLVADRPLHLAALRLAARFGLGATYDAHYLAVAQQEKADFWTTDRRLVNAVAAELPWVNLWR